LLKGEEVELVRKGIELAKAGDTQMLNFFLDRILPRERSVRVDLPAMEPCRERHERFRESDALRRVFEGVVAKCIAAGLVGGRGMFIDACLIRPWTRRAVDKKRVPGDEPIAWPKAEEALRALAQLPERKGGPCVSTVSIVCGPTGHVQGWARASCRRKRDMPDLRAVVLSRLRIHYR
jgi:hypothetical protein